MVYLKTDFLSLLRNIIKIILALNNVKMVKIMICDVLVESQVNISINIWLEVASVELDQ